MKLVLHDFCHNASFYDQLEFLYGSTEINYLKEGFEKFSPVTVIELYRNKVSSYEKKSREYKDKGEKVAKFLRKPDLEILILLTTLIKGIDSHQTREVEKTMRRLLLKRISRDPDFKYWSDPNTALSSFYKSLVDLGMFLHMFMMDGIQNA